jgi:hypothetical protein
MDVASRAMKTFSKPCGGNCRRGCRRSRAPSANGEAPAGHDVPTWHGFKCTLVAMSDCQRTALPQPSRRREASPSTHDFARRPSRKCRRRAICEPQPGLRGENGLRQELCPPQPWMMTGKRQKLSTHATILAAVDKGDQGRTPPRPPVAKNPEPVTPHAVRNRCAVH